MKVKQTVMFFDFSFQKCKQMSLHGDLSVKHNFLDFSNNVKLLISSNFGLTVKSYFSIQLIMVGK